MKIMARDIESIEYHRNGVGGAPFTVVRFTHREEDEEHPLIGIVFDQEDHVAVIHRDDPDSKWRGDRFEPTLREFIHADRLVRYGPDE